MSTLGDGRHGIARVVADRRLRRRIYAVLVAILLLLALFPRPYVARAKILPQENGSAAGLGSMIDVLGGRLNDFSALLGQRNSIESYLLIGRSNEVVVDVIRRLKLVGQSAPYASVADAEIGLAKKVDVHALLGGVMEIEAFTHDPEEARILVDAYLGAINDRIGLLSRKEVNTKRDLVEGRVKDAAERVKQTADALGAFRSRNHLADPEAQFGAALALRTQLEGTLQSKLVQLRTVSRFAGSDNVQLAALQSDIAALRAQIADTMRSSAGSSGPNLTAISQITSEYLNLYRDYKFAQGLYDVYARFSEQVELQEIAAESGADVQVIEAPYVDSERHYNVPAVALLCALLALIVFTELYAPATGLDPRRDKSAVE